MPRAPDPRLEERIVEAAVRLLDEQGLQAVTMRSVAAAAETTTPTLYERFADRDALVRAIVSLTQDEIIAAVQSCRTVEGFVLASIEFFCRYPRRFDLAVDTFGARFGKSEPQPVVALLRVVLAGQTGVRGRKLEDLVLAVVSLTLGTIRGMIATGSDTRRATELRRASISAMKLLLPAFQPRKDSPHAATRKR